MLLFLSYPNLGWIFLTMLLAIIIGLVAGLSILVLILIKKKPSKIFYVLFFMSLIILILSRIFLASYKS
ncbi:hypothetical protein BH11PAT1_BH11PAT1_4370 [soil metagenome]